MAYIIEFERSQKDGRDVTRVQLIDPTADTPGQKIMAETVFLGDPPRLHLEPGTTFTAIRLHKVGE